MFPMNQGLKVVLGGTAGGFAQELPWIGCGGAAVEGVAGEGGAVRVQLRRHSGQRRSGAPSGTVFSGGQTWKTRSNRIVNVPKLNK